MLRGRCLNKNTNKIFRFFGFFFWNKYKRTKKIIKEKTLNLNITTVLMTGYLLLLYIKKSLFFFLLRSLDSFFPHHLRFFLTKFQEQQQQDFSTYSCVCCVSLSSVNENKKRNSRKELRKGSRRSCEEYDKI